MTRLRSYPILHSHNDWARYLLSVHRAVVADWLDDHNLTLLAQAIRDCDFSFTLSSHRTRCGLVPRRLDGFLLQDGATIILDSRILPQLRRTELFSCSDFLSGGEVNHSVGFGGGQAAGCKRNFSSSTMEGHGSGCGSGAAVNGNRVPALKVLSENDVDLLNSNRYESIFSSLYQSTSAPEFFSEEIVVKQEDWVIVRSADSGCIFGQYVSHYGREVVLKNSRIIMSWTNDYKSDERIHIAELATRTGTTTLTEVNPDEVIILDACTIYKCNDQVVQHLCNAKRA